MPTVPQDQRQFQVAGLGSRGVAPQLSPNAPAEAFGGGQSQAAIGKAVGGLAETIGKIAEAEREKANDTATTDYYTKLAQKKQQLFWDPNAGVMAKRGKDSFAALDDYGKQFDSFADELEKGMNAEQLAMAKRIRSKERLDFDGQIMRHVSKESAEYQDQTVKAGIEVARNDALTGGLSDYLQSGTVDSIQQKIKLQEAIYQQTASGKPPSLVQAEMQEMRSKTHAALIDRMIDNGMDAKAKSYFESIKTEITGVDLDKVEKNLHAGVLAGESQRLSDSIYARTKSLEEAFAATQKIEDPKLRDETTKRVKDLFDMRKLAEKDREERNHKLAGNIIDKHGDTDKIPRSVWNTFSVSEKQSLESYAKNRREGTEPSTDWNEYYNLKTMAAAPEMRTEFQRLNLMQYRTKLGNAEFKELIGLQEGLRKGDGEAAKLADGFREDSEIVNQSLKEAGIDPGSKDEDDAKEVNLFRRRVDEKVIALQQKTGKKVTSQEMQKIVDDLMVQGITEKGWFWDTKKRKYQLNPGEKLEFNVEDIPASERAQIEAALKRRNIQVTDAKVLELYSRKAGVK